MAGPSPGSDMAAGGAVSACCGCQRGQATALLCDGGRAEAGSGECGTPSGELLVPCAAPQAGVPWALVRCGLRAVSATPLVCSVALVVLMGDGCGSAGPAFSGDVARRRSTDHAAGAGRTRAPATGRCMRWLGPAWAWGASPAGMGGPGGEKPVPWMCAS